MSQMKSEVKVATLHEMGVKLDNILEAAEREMYQHEGGKQALAGAKKRVEQHLALVDRDVQEGKLDLEQASLIKKWVAQCVHIVENLGIQAEVQGYQAQGKVLNAKHVVAVAKAMFDREKAQLSALAEAEKAIAEGQSPIPQDMVGRPDARPVGTHPGDPLADRRVADDSVMAAEAEAPTTQGDASVETPEATKPRKKRKESS